MNMFDKTTCPKCGGTGKAIGIGFMKIKCPDCDGTGKYKVPDAILTNPTQEKLEEQSPYDSPLPSKIRRGRPKGSKNVKT